jgi:hypothetical protein
MARPKKNQIAEQEVATSTPEVVGINNTVATVATVEASAVEEPTPPQVIVEPIKEPTPEAILPEIDKVEMDRYICVINNSNQASRIMQAVSHQRDLEMWGVHQYDNNRSRNSYARSFYFKNRENAVKALERAVKLASE